MINYETILSCYEDKLTLMQWISKVDEALHDATATGFHVNKTGTSTLTFTIDFDNGTTLTSEPVVINQGESVASAAINNGVLELTLTNGQVISAGNIFNGNLSLNGDLSVSGALSAASVTASGNIQGNNVSAVQSLSATSLTIGGNATFASNATVHGTLTVNGETTLNDDLICPYIDVSGSIDCGDTIFAVNKVEAANIETDTLNTSTASEISAQKPVVEVMTGYSFTQSNDIVWTPIYVGACKNGNKLTLVLFGSFEYDANGQNSPTLGFFTVPSAILQKLFPYESNYLEVKEVTLLKSPFNVAKKCASSIIKSTGSIRIDLRYLHNAGLTDGETYFIRIETTFLLSENLAA